MVEYVKIVVVWFPRAPTLGWNDDPHESAKLRLLSVSIQAYI